MAGALIGLGMLLPATSMADVYFTRDANGVFHFTNRADQSAARFRASSTGRERPDSGNPLRARQSHDRYDAIIQRTAFDQGVDPLLVKAVIRAESAFNPFARSPKGAQGLMQLMPATARHWGVYNAYDAHQNVRGGVRHLKMLLEEFKGNVALAVAAYNAGSGAVRKYRGIPPYSETQTYVRRVLKFQREYKRADLFASR